MRAVVDTNILVRAVIMQLEKALGAGSGTCLDRRRSQAHNRIQVQHQRS